MKFIAIVLVAILILAPFWLLSGWLWMLGLGALSDIFNIPNLAIGYWQSVLVGFIFSVLFGGVLGGSK